MINKPGIYPDIDPAAYYADPCPSPSLTQTLAKVLLERSPLHAWHQHPRLNSNYQERDGREPHLDIGNIAHRLLLGRGKNIAVIDAENWTTKAAREKRDEYAKQGVLGVLTKHYNKARAMHQAAVEQLEIRRLGGLFDTTLGNAECCIAWREDKLWLRQLVDWISTDRYVIADYKTTGESAAPHQLGRKLVDWGWHIQSAMAERGLNELGISVDGPRKYLWVCQESDPPHQLTVTEIGEAALTLGRWQLNTAIDIWRRCIETNQFPGYPLQIERPELPPWLQFVADVPLDLPINHTDILRV